MLLIALLAALTGAQAYTIETQPAKARHGAPATAHVEVVPVEGAHVSPDAPVSFVVKTGTLLKVDKARLGRAEAKETAKKGIAFDVPFTAATAGNEELKGTLNFFICTDTLCEKQTREIALAVTVE
jgi:hypothetical protein